MFTKNSLIYETHLQEKFSNTVELFVLTDQHYRDVANGVVDDGIAEVDALLYGYNAKNLNEDYRTTEFEDLDEEAEQDLEKYLDEIISICFEAIEILDDTIIDEAYLEFAPGPTPIKFLKL